MNVKEITTRPSTIILDTSAIQNLSNDVLGFMRYINAFSQLISQSNSVRYRILRFPDNSQIKSTNIQMAIRKESLDEIINDCYKDNNQNLLIIYGFLSEIVDCINRYQINNALIITDDDVSVDFMKSLPESMRVLPGRILFNLFDAFWWMITPYELIHGDDIHSGILPDGSINEITFYGQYALKLFNNNDISGAIKMLNECLEFYPNHVPTRLVYAGIIMSKFNKNLVPNEMKDTNYDLAEQMLMEANIILKGLGPANSNNQKDFNDIIMKINILANQLIFMMDKKRSKDFKKRFFTK